MADTDPGARGALVVKDKVVERLAAKAALDTDGVLPHSNGLGRLTGRDLPRVHVRIAGDRVRAGIDIAARWPTPLIEVTAAVRTNVARALTDYAGLQVDGIDVDVPTIIAAPTIPPSQTTSAAPSTPAIASADRAAAQTADGTNDFVHSEGEPGHELHRYH